jgi:phosphatidylglycerophosphate synthase
MNRSTNAERGPAAAGFGPVCSSVAGMVLHHLEGRRAAQEGSVSVFDKCATSPGLLSGHRSSTLLWIASAMNESSAKGIDRRPIATRNRKWAQAATAWLASRNVSPNAISIAGMCACIAAGIALSLTSVAYHRVFWLMAALGAQLRLTANMLDGMVALASGRASKVGELYNEVPDRVSDAAVFIGAGYAWGGNVALGYIATILSIFTAYVRAAGKIAGAPNEFCGPMAKQHRMLVVTVASLYSAVLPRSWQILHFDNVEPGVMGLALFVIIVGCLITAGRRLNRIAHALR